MENEKLTPHYIREKLQSQYIRHRNTKNMGVDEAIEATKQWAIREYGYVMGVSKPPNEWQDRLDKVVREIAYEN